MAAPVELIPPRPQTLWGWPAIANFALGGAGAGHYLVAALRALGGDLTELRLASALGPALVLAGFGAVATEAGRPWRGPRVLVRVASSPMSRELALGGAFAILAGLEFVVPHPLARLGAAAAALALALAQGAILRQARAVPAWSVAPMPAVFLASAAVSGTGLSMLIRALAGPGPDRGLLGGGLVLLALALVVWLAYLTWTDEAAFRDATRPLRRDAAVELIGLGYLVPFALAALALAWPDRAPLAGGLAAVLMLAGQVRAKEVLIRGVGQVRAISLRSLRLPRRTP